MSGAISRFAVKQMKKQILKNTITHSTGLSDYLGIKPLNTGEDVVLKELNNPNSSARKNVSAWTDEDYQKAINSENFNQNYMLQNMCNQYIKSRNRY